MRIAFVHDYLLRFGGAERVLLELTRMYPDAPIYTLFRDTRVTDRYFPGKEIHVSVLGRAPFIRRHHHVALPLLPLMVESFDLRNFDIIVSSSSAFVKGIVTRSHAMHIAYCHTPPRFLWEDRDTYRAAALPIFVSSAITPILHLLRIWDQHAAQRPDVLLANSQYTAERISRYYRRNARVVAPPVDLTVVSLRGETRERFALPDEYFLSVGRLTYWKRPDLTVETFNQLGLPLVMVGEGPLEKRLRRIAKRNIHFLGAQPDSVVRELMWGARGFLHPQPEDFGIALVEAMAQGTPAVAFSRGGAKETVSEQSTGEFFEDADPIAYADAVRRLRERWTRGQFQREDIRASVVQYSPYAFHKVIEQEIGAAREAARRPFA